MEGYGYKKINAFTAPGSLGNPAACIYLKENETMTGEEMQEVARQHKGFVSEVVYLKELKPEEYRLTYYSSECEVDFCGHGTVACMYSLISSTPKLMDRKEIPVYTNRKGKIIVYNRILEEDAVYISAPEPVYMKSKVTPASVAECLGIPEESLSLSDPFDFIDGGLKTLIVPVSTLSEEVSMYPDIGILREFCLTNGIDIILVYSFEVKNKKHFAHTRVFAPKFGYLEDPATGSGNSAFGYYLLKQRLWDGKPIAIEQGGIRMAYNTVRLYSDNSRVMFGGAAADSIVGKIII